MATTPTQREAITEETTKANDKAKQEKSVRANKQAREALYQGFNKHK